MIRTIFWQLELGNSKLDIKNTSSFSPLFRTSKTSDWKYIYGDVISDVAVDPTGVKVRVKFGDSKSNGSQDIRLPHFVTNDVDAGRRTPMTISVKNFTAKH